MAEKPTAAASRRVLQGRDRLVLWAPVLFGTGIGLYFQSAEEPSAATGPLLLSGCLLVGIAARAVGLGRSVLVMATLAALLAAGFTAASLRAAAVEAPRLTERIGAVEIEGVYERAEAIPSGKRVVIAPHSIERLSGEQAPKRIRIRVRSASHAVDEARPGDLIRVRAVLLPPPEPVRPGGYDFALVLYFQGIGAVGYALGPLEKIDDGSPKPGTVASLWSARLQDLRQTITERLLNEAPGETGPLAAALVTGERRAIPEEIQEAFRSAGLAHMLAISGLHMSLVAGFVFLLTRRILARIPLLALTQPIKTWAAAAALIVATGYLLISGAGLPAQRAFLMTTLALVAIAVHRSPFSLRLVALAALAVLAFQPEALLHPGFRMSFAAVIALIAAYEGLSLAYGPRLRATKTGLSPAQSAIRSVLLYGGGVILTSLIAWIATAPFAAADFNRLAPYALLGNLPAVPLMAFWILPSCLIAVLVMPLGLEGLVLSIAEPGFVLWTLWAQWVAGLPGSDLAVPAGAPWMLLPVVFGGLWLCLEPSRWRWAALPVIGIGLVLPWTVTPPDLLISRDGKVIAVRGPEGALWRNPSRAGSFSWQNWNRAYGPVAGAWAKPPRLGSDAGSISDLKGRLRCDDLGCVLHPKLPEARSIALPRQREALAADCALSSLVVTSLWVSSESCHGEQGTAPKIIDGRVLRSEGAHAVWLRNDGSYHIETVKDLRGTRPWAP
ncbi:MAG: ComEC/Rec2 family competence protein [Rhodospirillaceae bacterium]